MPPKTKKKTAKPVPLAEAYTVETVEIMRHSWRSLSTIYKCALCEAQEEKEQEIIKHLETHKEQ